MPGQVCQVLSPQGRMVQGRQGLLPIYYSSVTVQMEILIIKVIMLVKCLLYVLFVLMIMAFPLSCEKRDVHLGNDSKQWSYSYTKSNFIKLAKGEIGTQDAQKTARALMQSAGTQSPQSAYDRLNITQDIAIIGSEVKDLSPLAFFPNLERLSLHETSVENLDALENLRMLKLLYVYSAEILTDIDALSELNMLEYLLLENTAVTSIQPLSKINSLRSVSFEGNSISSFEPLKAHRQLDSIAIRDNQNKIPDLSFLEGLNYLRGLQLKYHGDLDLSVLSGLSALEDLEIYTERINSLNFLKHLKNLKHLFLQGEDRLDLSGIEDTVAYTVAITSSSLSDLSPLRDMLQQGQNSDIFVPLRRWIDLSNNGITDVSFLTSATCEFDVLDLSHNNIQNYSPINDLEIVSLKLKHSNLDNLASLGSGKNIQQILLANNPELDLRVVAGLTDIKVLELQECNLSSSDLHDLRPLKDLLNLHLDGNQIDDLQPLSDIRIYPTFLALSNNQIEDIGPLLDIVARSRHKGGRIELMRNPLKKNEDYHRIVAEINKYGWEVYDDESMNKLQNQTVEMIKKGLEKEGADFLRLLP